ncbi:hypothetical protein ACIQZB_43310 [Streptomyces sp. NPDC097727]|uniref:hypothetical protein n=1 Tax=Streptomyces sp. NPDC097727 TaxID=3366092 RepID=UPI003828CCD9
MAWLLPGARPGGAWELPGGPRVVRLGGRGLVLLPSFHWTGGALLSDIPDRPVAVTYPAGAGVLPTDGSAGPEALVQVIGDTSVELLHLLAEEHTTTRLARQLRQRGPAHTAALRGAGLMSTSRAGKQPCTGARRSAACCSGKTGREIRISRRMRPTAGQTIRPPEARRF